MLCRHTRAQLEAVVRFIACAPVSRSTFHSTKQVTELAIDTLGVREESWRSDVPQWVRDHAQLAHLLPLLALLRR